MPIPFIWYDKFYYVPWAKGALNRNLPATLPDDVDTDLNYRLAIKAWRERKLLPSGYEFDAAVQNSLIKLDNANPEYIKWVQKCLAASGEDPSLKATGSKNAATIDAIKIFQTNEVGLKDDGVVGPKTETALYLRTGIKPPGRYRKLPALGNIELPKFDPVIPDPDPTWMTHSSTWFGVGVKMGGIGGPGKDAGSELVRAYMTNYKVPDSYFFLEIQGARHGAGAGASGSWVFVVVTGMYDPMDLGPIALGGMDFSLAIGGPWGGMIKNLKALKNVGPMVRAARAGRLVGAGAELAKSAEDLKKVVTMAFVNPESTEVDVKVIDVLGTGLEVGLYYTVSKFNVKTVHWAE